MKKFFLIILPIFFLLFLGAKIKPIYAFQFGEGMDAYVEKGDLSAVPYDANVLYNITESIRCVIWPDEKCNPNKKYLGALQQNSMIGMTSDGIMLAYKAPISITTYIADMQQRIGIVKPAYAQQGIGFLGLQPLLKMWAGFRNIAYAFLTIILVIVGFMVMFRMKIDPHTVITVQSAIPRIIVTLLVVTFSYPIVALMIEIMYLVIFVAFLALGAQQKDPTLLNEFTGQGVLSHLVGNVWRTGMGSIDDIVAFLGLHVTTADVATTGQAVQSGVNAFGNNIFGWLAGTATAINQAGAATLIKLPLSVLTGALIGVLIAIALLIVMLRVFFMLLGAWIQILISVVFAPVQLMVGAIPGINAFGGWFRNLVGNLAVFPITAILLFIGSVLTSSDIPSKIWTGPGLGGTKPLGIQGVIGLGIIMSIPSLVGAFKKALQAQAIGGPGAIFAPFGTGLSAFMSGFNLLYQGTMVRNYFKKPPTPGDAAKGEADTHTKSA